MAFQRDDRQDRDVAYGSLSFSNQIQISRTFVLMIVAIVSAALTIPSFVPIPSVLGASRSQLEASKTVIKTFPIVPYLLGEQHAIDRVFADLSRKDTEVDKIYDSAKPHLVSEIADHLEQVVESEIERRMPKAVDTEVNERLPHAVEAELKKRMPSAVDDEVRQRMRDIRINETKTDIERDLARAARDSNAHAELMAKINEMNNNIRNLEKIVQSENDAAYWRAVAWNLSQPTLMGDIYSTNWSSASSLVNLSANIAPTLNSSQQNQPSFVDKVSLVGGQLLVFNGRGDPLRYIASRISPDVGSSADKHAKANPFEASAFASYSDKIPLSDTTLICPSSEVLLAFKTKPQYASKAGLSVTWNATYKVALHSIGQHNILKASQSDSGAGRTIKENPAMGHPLQSAMVYQKRSVPSGWDKRQLSNKTRSQQVAQRLSEKVATALSGRLITDPSKSRFGVGARNLGSLNSEEVTSIKIRKNQGPEPSSIPVTISRSALSSQRNEQAPTSKAAGDTISQHPLSGESKTANNHRADEIKGKPYQKKDSGHSEIADIAGGISIPLILPFVLSQRRPAELQELPK